MFKKRSQISKAPSDAPEHVYEKLAELCHRQRLAEVAAGSLSWTAGYWEGRLDEYVIHADISADDLLGAKLAAKEVVDGIIVYGSGRSLRKIVSLSDDPVVGDDV